MRAPLLIVLGFACCLCLATWLDPRFQSLKPSGGQDSTVVALALSDSRRMLATHFFAKADAYFHGGKYPSIFDEAPKEESHMTERGGAGAGAAAAPHEAREEHAGEQEEHEIVAEPADWIERFGRRFTLNKHVHLHGENAREILPWLKMAAELDSHRPTFYVTASFWLRNELKKPAEAEEFLRQGLRANPDSYEILSELGTSRLEKADNTAARQLWLRALQKWDSMESRQLKPDVLERMEILGKLAKLEQEIGLFGQAIEHLEVLKRISPSPDAVEKLIQEARAKAAAAPPKN